mgnify:CR=1 FL=1
MEGTHLQVITIIMLDWQRCNKTWLRLFGIHAALVAAADSGAIADARPDRQLQ